MRPDYCPIGNEPCQSLCDTPCTRTPQRTWVGLTEDERGGILVTYCEAGLWQLAEAIEAKLKEKNT